MILLIKALKFYIIGVINLLIFLITLKLLIYLTQNSSIAAVIASLASIGFSFLCLKRFVFSDHFIFRKFLIISAAGFITTQIYVFLLTPHISINTVILLTAILVSIQNFLLNKTFND